MVQVARVDFVDKPARVSMPQSAPKMQPQQQQQQQAGAGAGSWVTRDSRVAAVMLAVTLMSCCIVALSQRAADKWKPLVASSAAATAALYDSLIIYD